MSEPDPQLLAAVLTLFGAAIAFVIFLVYWRTLRATNMGKRGVGRNLTPTEHTDTFTESDDPDIAATPNDATDLNPEPPPRVGLSGLHAADPSFSEPDFVEEASLLYAALQQARATGDLGRWEGRLSPGAREDLLAGHAGLEAVTEVLQDLPHIAEASQDGEWAHLEVVFTALVVERRGGEPHTLLVTERWSFSRRLGVPGDLWRVVRVLDRQLAPLARPPLERARSVERGGSLATVKAPNLEAAAARLAARLGRDALAQLVATAPEIYRGVAAALDEQDDRALSLLIAPRAAEAWAFARERLARVGLRQRMVEVEVLSVTPARLDLEPHDALATLRIEVRCRTWVETADGTLAGGVPDDSRHFSEYCTFLLPLDRPDARWRLWRRTPDEEYTG